MARGRKIIHGMLNTRIYHIWQGMKRRCYYIKYRCYNGYGGRGIKVCEEWKNNFIAFYNWSISNGYKDNLTLDRIDTNGNYEPKNCRFVSIIDQNRNKRNNLLITYNGETKCLSKWAEDLGINYSTLSTRLSRNWDISRAFSKR